MRVLHLSTSLLGGAGVAAQRIVSSQVKIGLDSQLLCRTSKPHSVSEGIGSIVGKINTVFSRAISEENYDFISPLSISNLSLKNVKKIQPDIINIHNWYNYLSLSDLRKLGEHFPLVFTMHDARLVTGGCHVTLGCKNFENSCGRCPASKVEPIVRLSRHLQVLNFSKIQNYALVFPSEWLRQELNSAEICRQAKFTEVIPNPINFDKGISEVTKTADHIEVCFVSATLDSNFKGIHMLKEAMKIFSKQNPTIRVQLNLVGFSAREHDEDFGNVTLKKVGPVSSSRMVELIKKADYLLVPSQSDNLPNVISESQNLGTLVVATDVGGIPEMIVDGVTGFLSKNSALDFAITLKRALDSKDSLLIREQARDAAESRCSEENAGLHYKKVYEKLLVL